MRKFLFTTTFIFSFLYQFICQAGCLTDSVITYYGFSNDDYQGAHKNYNYTIYHRDLGTFDQCSSQWLSNDTWSSLSCISGYYKEYLKKYNSSGLLNEIRTRQGTATGWRDTALINYNYTNTGKLISEFHMISNGANWDTTYEMIRNYNTQENITEEYVREKQNGSWQNIRRFIVQYNSSVPASKLFQNGNGSTWVNSSLYSYVYISGIRTGISIQSWDNLNSVWGNPFHGKYGTGTGYSAKLSVYDTLIISGYTLVSEHRQDIDTLDNIIYVYSLVVNGIYDRNGYTTSKEYGYTSTGELKLLHDFGASLFSYFDDNGELIIDADYACTNPNTYYNYDSLGRLISNIDHSRCGMPRMSGYTYSYDSTGLLTKTIYERGSNTSQGYAEDNYTYATVNNVSLLISPNDKFPDLCQNSTYQPAFVLAGGCGPYNVRWFPATGLSSDSVLNPVITVHESIAYTIYFSDQSGTTDSVSYMVDPGLTFAFHVDTTCGSGYLSTLSATSSENGLHFQWYRDNVVITGADQNIYHVTQPGAYYIEINKGPGKCNATSHPVFVSGAPVTIYATQSASICQGDQYILPDGSAALSNGSFVSHIQTIGGCDSIVTINLTVINPTTDSIRTTTCQANYILPDGQTVSQSGYYTSILKSKYGCDSTIVTLLTIESFPVAVSISGSTQFCAGDSVTLSTDGLYSSYAWNDGSTSSSITIKATGFYNVLVVTDSGCSSNSLPVYIQVNPLPVVSLGNDTLVCNNQSIILDAGNDFTSYTWQDGSMTQTFVAYTSGVSDSTRYSVLVTDNNGCSNSDAIEIIFDVCAGIDNNDLTNTVIFPNPAIDYFIVQAKNLHSEFKIYLSLFDVTGKMILETSFIDMQKINISTLSNGFYQYKIYSDTGIQTTGKLIIE